LGQTFDIGLMNRIGKGNTTTVSRYSVFVHNNVAQAPVGDPRRRPADANPHITHLRGRPTVLADMESRRPLAVYMVASQHPWIAAPAAGGACP
jgi:hypothetical protein